ncbi:MULTISPECIES: hypothetical protein [unclassified Acidocella]|uniref:hypothetical protein n=1 Tax=unclassified Acidocella TaxID=2648610 RepID=UPI0005876EFC|nr:MULTISPECIES: hypothetical protein [unclassified Acidocella]WBO60552.1 hypothetical protein GT370_07215 [Acidocella sp. MX-AZ03]
MSTQTTVKAVRGFMAGGKMIEPGMDVTLPARDAKQLTDSGRAARVTAETAEPKKKDTGK